MRTKKKGSMKKQIIGTVLASAVILAAVGAAGFVNDKMSATDGLVEVSILPTAVVYSIVDPLDGAVITDTNYTVRVDTIRNEELRFFNCYGAEIATCGQPNGGNGVGYVSSTTIDDPAAWSEQHFNADFLPGQEGEHRLMVIGYIDGVAVDMGRYVDVNYFRQHDPSLTVEIPGGTVSNGVTTLPEGDTFQIKVSYNDVNSLGVNINGKDVDTSSCTITNPVSGMVTCTVKKSDYPADKDADGNVTGKVTIVVSGKDADGNVVVTKKINAIDPDAVEVPNTGVAGGLFTLAREDMFLGGVVALLAIGLMTVYILFRRSSRA